MNLKTLVHLIMVVFAAASFSNVRAYFAGAGHNWIASVALGIALGGSLVVVSFMLTHVDRQNDRATFNLIVWVGVGLGIVSGCIQAAEYMRHLQPFAALLLGFGVPLLGEVGLALAAAAYLKARDRERFRSVSLSIEKAAADQLEAAVASFDPALVRKYIERQLSGLVRLAVDSAVINAAQFYARPEDNAPAQLTQDLTLAAPQVNTEVNNEGVNVPKINTDPGDLLNARRNKAAQRQDALLDHLRTLDGQPSDVLNKTALGDQFGVTRQTISNDLEVLQQSNRLILNGHIQVKG